MKKLDHWVLGILIAAISIHFVVLIIGYKTNQLAYLSTLLNLISGLCLIFYWIQKEIRKKQHAIELREMLVLGVEILLIGCAVYTITSHRSNIWLIAMQAVFFTIHFVCLILFLIFMLTFKIKKLI